MFINQQGPPTRDPTVRRTINIHLSHVAKAKRLSKDEAEKPGRREAQQHRRLRKAAQVRKLRDVEQQATSWLTARRSLNNELLLPSDFLRPSAETEGRKYALKACNDFFTVLVPLEAKALGLSSQKITAYAKALLNWAYQHETVLFGLAIYRLCTLPVSQDPASKIRSTVESLRSELLRRINDKLESQEVDDVLVQAVVLATVIDNYLGYIDFSRVHLEGLKKMIELRGGLAMIGSSAPGIGDNLQQSLLIAVSTTVLNLGTALGRASPVPSILTYPELSIRKELSKMVAMLPTGFQGLAWSQHLSVEMVEILASFAGWSSGFSPETAASARVWRPEVPAGLSDLEKCVIVALVCLADDMTKMGDHISILLFRKPRQRAEMLLAAESLWGDPRVSDCLIWLATVVTTPKRTEISPYDLQTQLFDEILERRHDLDSVAAIEHILFRFFMPTARASFLLQAWENKLCSF